MKTMRENMEGKWTENQESRIGKLSARIAWTERRRCMSKTRKEEKPWTDNQESMDGIGKLSARIDRKIKKESTEKSRKHGQKKGSIHRGRVDTPQLI